MTTNRRDFLKTAALVGCAAAVTSRSAAEAASLPSADYSKLDEVLNSPDHAWFLNKMDPAEAERREKAAREFRGRYDD